MGINSTRKLDSVQEGMEYAPHLFHVDKSRITTPTIFPHSEAPHERISIVRATPRKRYVIDADILSSRLREATMVRRKYGRSQRSQRRLITRAYRPRVQALKLP